MLVTAKEMLEKAVAGHYAVGQFNINNLEWTKAILTTAQELNSPVILGVSEGAGKYMAGYKTVVGMVKGMMEELNITVPVALHLDHGSYEGCLKCVEAGFSSIMFDGSHYPIEENIAKTKELVKICAEHNMSLEAEVGSIGGEEDGVIGMGECADPNECKAIADLGVTMLAAGIGNIHGKYPANWKGLSFETLAAVKELTGDMPLVLHGGTGIPADMIKKAISLGVAKINVNTECQLSFADATRKYIEAGKDLEGNDVDDSIFSANAVTVVNFWFNGCKPCVAELSKLNELNETLKGMGGELIGINTETLDGNKSGIEEALKLLESQGASYRNIYFDSDTEAGRYAGNIMAFPTTILIDRNGNIVGEPFLGGIDNQDNYDQLLEQINAVVAADSNNK